MCFSAEVRRSGSSKNSAEKWFSVEAHPTWVTIHFASVLQYGSEVESAAAGGADAFTDDGIEEFGLLARASDPLASDVIVECILRSLPCVQVPNGLGWTVRSARPSPSIRVHWPPARIEWTK